jgi:arylsulfatase A-like enzyme
MLHLVLLEALLACNASDPADPAADTGADDLPCTPDADAGNILVIVLDDVGLDKVGVYGLHPDPPPTPNIDALAARGMRFTNAWAEPTCSPSRAALLTGRQPARTGMGTWLYTEGEPFALRDEEVTLPEVLAGADPPYTSSVIGKWHLTGFDAEDPATHPLRAGFQHHRGSLGNPTSALQEGNTPRSYTNWEKNVDGVVEWTDTYMTVDSTDEAIAAICELPEPWFIYLAYNAPHDPYHAPPAELTTLEVSEGDDDVTLYAAMLEAADTEIGRLLDHIAGDERMAGLNLFLLSDNGTPAAAITSPWDPQRGKGTLYEGGVRVPLIAVGPAVGCEGCVSDALVHITDLFPTVAELAGVAPPPSDGASLLPALADPDAEVRGYLFSEQFDPVGAPPYGYHERALRDRRWKLVVNEESGWIWTRLYRVPSPDEGVDEGRDLLTRALDDDAQQALERLSTSLDAVTSEASFEL